MTSSRFFLLILTINPQTPYPNRHSKSFPFVPPILVGKYCLQPPAARAKFLHNDLLCNVTCSVTDGKDAQILARLRSHPEMTSDQTKSNAHGVFPDQNNRVWVLVPDGNGLIRGHFRMGPQPGYIFLTLYLYSLCGWVRLCSTWSTQRTPSNSENICHWTLIHTAVVGYRTHICTQHTFSHQQVSHFQQ